MHAFFEQFRVSLRLHFRNRMAIVYSYLFPTIFLIAFYVLYRHEPVPLIRHMGELLTVTALGGACFGLPTSLVSERERGVWRRYRLTPVPTSAVLASTILARYVLLLIAGLLQVVLAMGLGMPLPNHPFDLWVAFTFVAFALLGLGLVIAMLANNVPAVQALGQCIFLPMLIIGGVAVQLASLPEWAQRVSAYFPGRYAVEAMQVTVTGPGLGAAGFALLALLMIGGAGFLAGAKMFRWDTEQRIVTGGGKGWVAVALGAWLAVGLLAEAQGRIAPPVIATGVRPPAVTPPPVPAPEPAPVPDSDEMEARTPAPADPPEPEPTRDQPADPAPVPERVKPVPPLPTPPAVDPPVARADPPATTPAPEPPPPPSAPPDGPPPAPETWRDVTRAHIDEIVFARLPSDRGVVSPIGPADEPLDPDTEAELEEVRSRLPTWGPALVDDPVQRVRNVLYVAAVPDVFQLPVERHMPHVVFERLMADIPKEDLIKILYYVATHPWGGDDSAVDDLRSVGLRIGGPQDMDQTRERVMLYALKLLGRLVGEIPW
jgi:ABC-type transport system involved in cytochrome c biogenesis permease component